MRILERRGVAVSAADAAAVQQLLDGSRASASVGWVSLSNHLLISVSRPAGPFANRRVVWLTREGGRGARGGSLAHGCKARVTSLDSVLAVTRLKLEDVARLSPPAGGAHVTVEQLLADTRASSGWNDASLSSAWQPLYELWNREATFAKEPCFRGTKVPAQHASAAPLFNEVVAIVAPIDASAGAAEQAFRIALARVGKHHTPTVGENWSVAYFGPGRVSNTASRSMLLHGRELFAELSRWTADAGGAAAGGAAAAGSAAADGGGHKRRRENDGGGDGGGGEGEEGGGGGGAGEGGGGPASTLVPARAPAPADGRRGGRGGRGRGVGRGGRGGRGGGGGGGESEGGGLAPTLMPAPAPAPDGGRGGRGRGFGPGSVGAQQRASAEAMPPPPPLAPRPAPTATAGEPSVLNPPPRGGAGGVVNSNAPPRGTGAAGFGGGGSGGGAAAAGGAAARPPLERAMDLVLEQSACLVVCLAWSLAWLLAFVDADFRVMTCLTRVCSRRSPGAERRRLPEPHPVAAAGRAGRHADEGAAGRRV